MSKPLFPDQLGVHYARCWNCGRSQGLSVAGSLKYLCECGCGWSDRYGLTREHEVELQVYREGNIARQLGIELVDFTKPHAPSAPA